MLDGQRVPPSASGEATEQEASPAEEVASGISVPPFGVIGHAGDGPGGPGFGSGTTLDGLEPGPVLVAALDETWDAGLTRLSDDELAGVALAWRRCESRAAAGLLAAVGELSRRRAGLRTGPVQAGSCSHAREVPGYRIPESLHHIVKTRQRTCSAPYCSRPAERCDDDHTLPYDQGGRTCECDLAPLCRRDHQAKQAQGWRLLQPSPGVLVWELPHGRRYLVTPDIYPT